jgi:hypothetical protein
MIISAIQMKAGFCLKANRMIMLTGIRIPITGHKIVGNTCNRLFLPALACKFMATEKKQNTRNRRIGETIPITLRFEAGCLVLSGIMSVQNFIFDL